MDLSLLIERHPEKYGRKLIGKTHMEDVLKRIDELTREIARMATMEVLRATHSIDDRVRGIDNRVLDIDGRVHAIDNKVHGVDEFVVDDRVAGVETNLTKAISGTQVILVIPEKCLIRPTQTERKRGKPRKKRLTM